VAKRKSKKQHVPTDDALSPTLERVTHNKVQRYDNTIQDIDGRISRPYQVMTLLCSMEIRGVITRLQMQSGIEFHEYFQKAGLDPLGCLDLSKPFVSSSFFPAAHIRGNDRARDQIAYAIRELGGIKSHHGSCAWHVLGLEHPLSRWVIEIGLRLRDSARSRILCETLGMLSDISLGTISSRQMRISLAVGKNPDIKYARVRV
jgi:hypothetical protein